MKISVSAQTRLIWRRFVSIRRGYWSLIFISLLVGFCLVAELFVNNRALIVRYQDRWFFPTYGDMIPGSTFGLGYDYETNYRELKRLFESRRAEDFVLLPPVPYNPFENDLKPDSYPPFPPSIEERHFLGTDITGRDVLARLVYGFRTAIVFSLLLTAANYGIGIAIGCAMGYAGGWFDLMFQRLIEIWSNVPVLYIIIILASLTVPSVSMLILIMVVFGWVGITWVMRTATYKEKAREYVLAARALGAGHLRIVFRHILPNTLSVIVTFVPFSISGGIVALTALDYLGFGLPAPTPSWGELLQQGWENFDSWWIVGSVITAMIVTLTAVTFIGEAVREAFDPKRHTLYEG
ncbi:MAG: ABC transporter permease subunit [Thermodesulfobacteriota bacterium]